MTELIKSLLNVLLLVVVFSLFGVLMMYFFVPPPVKIDPKVQTITSEDDQTRIDQFCADEPDKCIKG